MKQPATPEAIAGEPLPDRNGGARETLLLRQLPLAVTFAHRYTERPEIDDQLIEAALVGLVLAVDNAEQLSDEAFARHAEMLIDRELAQFIEDCRLEREDRILQRERLAASALVRVEQALLRRDDIRLMAASLGLQPDELASGFVSALIQRPEILALTETDAGVGGRSTGR